MRSDKLTFHGTCNKIDFIMTAIVILVLIPAGILIVSCTRDAGRAKKK